MATPHLKVPRDVCVTWGEQSLVSDVTTKTLTDFWNGVDQLEDGLLTASSVLVATAPTMQVQSPECDALRLWMVTEASTMSPGNKVWPEWTFSASLGSTGLPLISQLTCKNIMMFYFFKTIKFLWLKHPPLLMTFSLKNTLKKCNSGAFLAKIFVLIFDLALPSCTSKSKKKPNN